MFKKKTKTKTIPLNTNKADYTLGGMKKQIRRTFVCKKITSIYPVGKVITGIIKKSMKRRRTVEKSFERVKRLMTISIISCVRLIH